MVERGSYRWDVFRVVKMKPESIFLYKNGPELISEEKVFVGDNFRV